MFYTNMIKNVHLSKITYLRYLVKMKHHISYLYNALLEYYLLHQLNDRPDGIIHRTEVSLVSSVATCLALWAVIQQRMYETRVHDIDELQQRLLHVWRGLEQSLIDDADDQWQTHLRACVRASGGHFEHTLFSLYLMNFMFYTMLDAACNIQRVHYKSMKCDVFIFTR